MSIGRPSIEVDVLIAMRNQPSAEAHITSRCELAKLYDIKKALLSTDLRLVERYWAAALFRCSVAIDRAVGFQTADIRGEAVV